MNHIFQISRISSISWHVYKSRESGSVFNIKSVVILLSPDSLPTWVGMLDDIFTFLTCDMSRFRPVVIP